MVVVVVRFTRRSRRWRPLPVAVGFQKSTCARDLRDPRQWQSMIVDVSLRLLYLIFDRLLH